MHRSLQLALCAVVCAASAAHAQGSTRVFAAGMQLPVRFLQAVEGGRDSVGTPVLVQTMAPLTEPDCVAAPAYVELAGRITRSRSGGRFGRRGMLAMEFDSVRAQPGTWLPVDAVLDSLEYTAARDLRRNGRFYGAHVSLLRRLSSAGVIAAATMTGIDEIPGALAGIYWAMRHGPRARILPGESGSVTLVEPLSVSAAACMPAAAPVSEQPLALPAFEPHTTNRTGRAEGDPINFVFEGTAAELDTAFAGARWPRSQARRPLNVARAVISTIAKLHASNPPLSRQFFEGRVEDFGYELQGPNARIRHHIRIWRLDDAPDLWVGAATLDDGIKVGKVTHRIDPRIDEERDFLGRDLEAGGCAQVSRYVRLPGAGTEGTLAHGQRFVSDGRAAVVKLGC